MRKNIESLEKALEVLDSFLGKNLMADRNEEFEIVEDICDTLMESSEKCMYLEIREVKSLYNLQYMISVSAITDTRSPEIEDLANKLE